MRAIVTGLTVGLAVLGCDGNDSSDPELLIVMELDTLISTDSGLIGMPLEAVITPSGAVAVADFQSNQITVLGPSRSIHLIGQPGEGPGEFAGVWGLQVSGDDLLINDRGNGRVQRMALDGTYLDSWPVTPLVRSSFPYLLSDGSVLLGSMGRDSTLAYAFDVAGQETRRIGVPVAPVPAVRNFSVIREAIDRGEVPDQIRNEVIVAGHPDGRIWIALQTEGVLQQYAADGTMEWSLEVQAPEMAQVKEQFFQRNQAEQSSNRYHSLRYFADLFPLGDELWVLLTTLESGPSAVVLVLGEAGVIRRRIEFTGAGGANTLAVDPLKQRVVLSTSHDAQVLMAEVP